jgi:ABC-type glycerol-3-phosphate transport system substrate-binding protein
MKNLRNSALIALLLLSVAAVVAGATSARNDGGRSATPSAPRTAPAGQFSYFDFGSAQNPPTQKLLREYQRTHPQIHIKFISGPVYSQNLAWLDTQLAGGTAPDVVTLSTNEQPWRDLKKGWWDDLTKYAMAPDPYVKGNKHWIDLLTPGAAKLLRFANGKIYAMSTTGFDVGFIYNKDIFAKLHLAVPKTWAQMISTFQTIKAANYIPLDWQLGAHEYGGETEQFLTILEGTTMHKTIQRMDTNHDGVVDIKEMVRAIRNHVYSASTVDYQENWKLLKDLSTYFQLGASATTDPNKGFNLFKTGRVATWFEGSYNAPRLAAAHMHWGAFALPRLTNASTPFATAGPQPTGGFGACCGYPWAVPVTAEKNGNIKPAMDFIYWMSTPKHTDQFANGAGVLSVEKHAAPLSANMKPFAEAAAHVSPLATAELSLPPQFIENRSRILEEYINGTIDLPTAMQRMQHEMNVDEAQAAKIYGLGK